ncbi:unnamed protein product [Adineta steineri]|uniref:NAD(P)(+)--arginine ADP-ribosyltransferase n=1 Tax=Adineta steineri TaxID=433720 RepID=A0A819RU27_9BILA|nr:unnamed protein product [Adineta steineri]CAF4043250.1 unnamed protein product [Adineta steineri]
MSVSEFYIACRNGDLAAVQRLLPSLTVFDINRMEPNESTALHAASYYGHHEIVQLLLEAGAIRSTLNMYKMTPADEAATPEIKKLFNRRSAEAQGRYTATAHNSDWAKMAIGRSLKSAAHRLANTTGFGNMNTARERIIKAVELRDAQGMDEINYFLSKGCDTNDTSCLLRAYTAETDFYRRLNIRSAQLNSQGGHPSRDIYVHEWSLAFAAQLSKDPTFEKFYWTGTTYRGMKMTEYDLSLYKNKHVKRIVLNSFLSTSKNREVALAFAASPLPDQFSVLCKYVINQPWSALDLKTVSEYPEEEEVLVVPNMCYNITDLKEGNLIEIELVQGDMTSIMSGFVDKTFTTDLDG